MTLRLNGRKEDVRGEKRGRHTVQNISRGWEKRGEDFDSEVAIHVRFLERRADSRYKSSRRKTGQLRCATQRGEKVTHEQTACFDA